MTVKQTLPYPLMSHAHSMHVLPSSHKDGVYKHSSDNGHIEYSMVKKPNPDDVSHMTRHVKSHDFLLTRARWYRLN